MVVVDRPDVDKETGAVAELLEKEKLLFKSIHHLQGLCSALMKGDMWYCVKRIGSHSY